MKVRRLATPIRVCFEICDADRAESVPYHARLCASSCSYPSAEEKKVGADEWEMFCWARSGRRDRDCASRLGNKTPLFYLPKPEVSASDKKGQWQAGVEPGNSNRSWRRWRRLVAVVAGEDDGAGQDRSASRLGAAAPNGDRGRQSARRKAGNTKRNNRIALCGIAVVFDVIVATRPRRIHRIDARVAQAIS